MSGTRLHTAQKTSTRSSRTTVRLNFKRVSRTPVYQKRSREHISAFVMFVCTISSCCLHPDLFSTRDELLPSKCSNKTWRHLAPWHEELVPKLCAHCLLPGSIVQYAYDQVRCIVFHTRFSLRAALSVSSWRAHCARREEFVYVLRLSTMFNSTSRYETGCQQRHDHDPWVRLHCLSSWNVSVSCDQDSGAVFCLIDWNWFKFPNKILSNRPNFGLGLSQMHAAAYHYILIPCYANLNGMNWGHPRPYGRFNASSAMAPKHVTGQIVISPKL